MQFDADAEAAVADLTARETECCSFFDFTLTPAGQRLLLDVTVPAGEVGVLDALASRAAAAAVLS